MKKITVVLLALSLAGCSTIVKLMPRAYDPVQGDLFVTTQLSVDQLSCSAPDAAKWKEAEFNAKKLGTYSTFRKDPQAENASAIESNLVKADGKAGAVCESFLKIAKLRLEVVKTAWRGR
jgi:hypothetical protein